MKDHKNQRSSSFDPILDDYKKKEKKLMENECITGSPNEEDRDRFFSGFRKNRILYLLTQLMFILGILIAIVLWITAD